MLEIERKFLIRDPSNFLDSISPKHINQVYLKTDSEDTTERVRKTRVNSSYPKFFHTKKKHVETGICEEKEVEITLEDYNAILEKSPAIGSIEKDRYYIVRNGFCYEIDRFIYPVPILMMEVELNDINQEIPWLKEFELIEEVTGNIRYSNAYIAEHIRLDKYSKGSRVWTDKDRFHRDHGPAIEWADGTKAWYLKGKLHRENGPAVERANGHKRWCLDGREYSKEEHALLTWERLTQEQQDDIIFGQSDVD